MAHQTIYECAGETSRRTIRKVSFVACLGVAALMLTLTGFNIAAEYFEFDFYTVLLLSIVSTVAAFLIRAGRVTGGATVLIGAIQVAVVVDPYPYLEDPLTVSNFLIGDCLGFVITALLAALFVSRALVIGLTLVASANIIVVAVLSNSRGIQESSPIIVAGVLVAGALVAVLTSLFRRSLQATRFEERKAAALKEQLLHAQKLEALGRFAGVIAHDYNNILTAILGQTDIVMAEQDLPRSARENLRELQRYAEKAADLVRQLLLFSRKKPQEDTAIDACAALRDIEGMMRTLVSRGVELSIRADEARVLVRLNVGQFEQVVVNLVVNAQDATSSGGRITVRAQMVDARPPLPDAQPPLKPGRYAAVSVRDTGTGMDDEVKSHLFEPFYTTKPEGEGTGLGLSTVYAIVTAAGGGVAVTSEPGEGSEFTIYLPAAPEPSGLGAG